ncbi:transposon protein, putative, CACTA, En/Spm sub-class [Cucumis melo var. makuwa]|uniref:Transposon protein, putative, CACTA, En/Spm sub-class n=1 Tax=Cucumis melo var. makuwa TaxID=1194695 RepID=A0A5A7TFG0_CUCMM|nr:transposon protein, putative, CACTA, En/Spm sub-class [Cucumis melo var. makuwa]
MRWHKDKRVDTEDVLRHPADAAGWKHFDKEFPQFASEPRNVRLGLASDGFNPFGNMSTAYSMWPVVLIPYNLPPWKCMKESNFFMYLLVLGPKSPGKELDVYLQPLIDELKELWNNGVRTFDCTDEEYFRLHTCLLWTINDFPAYGDLSGWSTKEYQACPTCKEDTSSRQHDDKFERRPPPVVMNGDEILQQVNSINFLVLIELCNFFRDLCAKTIRVSDLNRLEADIVLILCKLERIFPPAFFDIMIHLAVHLPAETKIVGPVSYSWMYPIERSLRTLKQYVRNKARPEGSIAEAFIMNECLTFCSMYLIGIETRFNRNPRNDDSMNRQLGCGDFDVFKQNVRPMGGSVVRTLSEDEKRMCHWYVLNNCCQIESYRREHLSLINTRGEDVLDLFRRHQLEFPNWFRTHMYSLRERGEASDDLYSIALGPINEVRTYSGCFVNGLRFHSIERDNRWTTQNTGIMAYGETKVDETNYYGVLQEVLDLEYLKCRRVCLFKCNWFDTDVKKNKFHCDLGFKIINTSHFWYTDDPYILATQAVQVFYIDDPKLRSIWKIVQIVQNKQVWDIPESEEVEDDKFELLEACSSIGVDESIHDIPFCRGDVEPTVVDHKETENQDQSRIDDDFINDETEQLQSSDSDDQTRLTLTEVEQTNTPSVDPSTPSGSQLGTKKRGRGVRGYGRNIELDKFVEKHGKIKIEINEEEGKPVTTFAPKIALGIGTALRNTIPLSCENWKAVPMGVRELVIDRLETHFEFDPTNMVVRKYLEEKMQNIFREFRADLHKYYCQFDDSVEARANPPNRITYEDWNMMCDRWETDAWKKKGCDVDEIEVFHETHFREKEGWINDKAKDAYLEMQRIITESTEAGVQTISTAKACEFVLGSRSMQTVNPRSGESLRSNVSSTREKEKNEMTYLKEANEKLTHELAKWEQSYGSQ